MTSWVGASDTAFAQSCTVAGGSTVTLTSGTCAIDPNTSLTGTPAVHASTSAQITTNNVNINPFNGGSIGGLADTNGTIIFSTGSSINGNWSVAASAQSGGQIIFESGSAINPAFGGGGTALLADGTGTQIRATGLTVGLNSGGNNVAGKATNGATINLLDTAISYAAGGGGNTGLWASGTGSQIATVGTTIAMPGGGGNDVGVRADTGGTATLTGGTVSVEGNGGGETGLLAQSAGSSIAANGLAVTISGGGGDVGAKALDGAAITMRGGSVAAIGNNAEIAVQATGTGSTVTADGTAISTRGDNSVGVQADSAGHVSLTNATVNTVGASSTGLLATGANSSINATGGTVTTSGATAHAAVVTAGGALDATADLTATGAGSNALNISGGSATLTVSILTSPNGASIAATGGISNVTLNGVEAIANNGQWLTVSGGAVLDLLSDGSRMRGAAITDAGSTSNVTLQNGSLWTMTASSNITNLTNAVSEIDFTAPTDDPTLLSSYKTLTTVNYVGRSSTIALNTFLGSDGSPSDRLVIDGGTASGNTFLKISNTIGAGALTTGNGILVVDAINGATTTADAFSLSRPVLAGPYRYSLYRSSVDASDPQSWYLRSTLVCANHPELRICGGGGGGGGGG
ncbi:hypothetical protein LUG63_07850, partial [Bradyrhizobium japonicum]|nr:hypothetical protein [Bradyrhizobium japonicum]